MLTIKLNQTLPDMAVQHTGSIEGLMSLAAVNGKSITDDTVPGDELVGVQMIDKKVVRFFEAVEYDVTTKKKPPVMDEGGIGYMRIGTTFKVS